MYIETRRRRRRCCWGGAVSWAFERSLRPGIEFGAAAAARALRCCFRRAMMSEGRGADF